MNQEAQSKKTSQLVAKCWVDEGFKRKLLANPAATLKAEGVELPAGMSVKVLENTDRVFHLVIPARPADLSNNLSEEELDKVVAAGLLVSSFSNVIKGIGEGLASVGRTG